MCDVNPAPGGFWDELDYYITEKLEDMQRRTGKVLALRGAVWVGGECVLELGRLFKSSEARSPDFTGEIRFRFRDRDMGYEVRAQALFPGMKTRSRLTGFLLSCSLDRCMGDWTATGRTEDLYEGQDWMGWFWPGG